MPGLAKTRLIPALGADGAAALQERLIRRAVVTATDAALGPVALWAAPDGTHPLFQALRRRYGVALGRQPDGDLGARMQEAATAANGPVLIVGTDCPALDADHLHLAAATLRNYDVVVIPAEDGGYVLIGLRRPHADAVRGHGMEHGDGDGRDAAAVALADAVMARAADALGRRPAGGFGADAARGSARLNDLSPSGHSRRFGDVRDMSGLPPITAMMLQCHERKKPAQ